MLNNAMMLKTFKQTVKQKERKAFVHELIVFLLGQARIIGVPHLSALVLLLSALLLL